ncbi:MAG: SMC family ATPase [Candidatus Babeliales bacterium]|nr:SMC family ATPase [Candidatus Babeliales bacterium]
MIPLNLQIKNFLSYGSELQTINFEPYNLICLSGKNGHGKSALLDAMAWAVWGEARKTTGTSKPDQGLLRLGQRQMIVIFDFEFNKNKYRIRREFSFSYGKPNAHLDFGLYEGDEKIISLTDKTIKATQDKIESMLGLNFESFCNSAFLRQGSSNEFSKKSPKDRKEILANILGLGKFETLRKIAMEKIKSLTNQRDGNLKLNEMIEKELTYFDEVNSKLIETKNQIEKITKEEEEYLISKSLQEQEKKKLSVLLNEQQMLILQLQKLQEEHSLKTKDLIGTYNLWHETHKKRINFPDKEKLELEKQACLKIIETSQQLQHQQLELKEIFLKTKEEEQNLLKILNDKQAIEIQNKKLELERSLINKINTQEKLKELNNSLQQLTQDNNKINLATVDEQLILKAEKQFDKRRNYYQKFIAQGNQIKSELNALEQKCKLSSDDQNPSCPLCEQNLSASRKKFLKQQFANQEIFLNHRLKRITGLISKLKDILMSQHNEIKSYKDSLELNKTKAQIEKQILELKTQSKDQLKILNDLEIRITEEQKLIEHLKIEGAKLIAQDEKYKVIQANLNEINLKIAEIKYNSEEHKKVISQLASIDMQLAAYNNVDLTTLREQYKREFLSIIANLRLLKNDIKILKQNITNFGDLKLLEQNLNIKERDITDALKALLKFKETILHQRGSLENQISKLEQLSQECKKYKEEASSLQNTMDDYKTISIALSKDGIQALLIEESIPEIEHAANEILAKLTDNQAQIIIESVRDLKKGGIKETLDIKISDDIGIRPYEMFSGGEAFRIDFALRIAISKLLAHRSGTSLQTLIIDEGFGSQDEEGLAHIMDSIYKIQDDFAKIIIVSHLQTMKEQFPVHFVVEKGPAGSRVEVVEQG